MMHRFGALETESAFSLCHFTVKQLESDLYECIFTYFNNFLSCSDIFTFVLSDLSLNTFVYKIY